MEVTDAALIKPTIKPRNINLELQQLALKNGLSPIIARILAARPITNKINKQDLLELSLLKLDSPLLLQDSVKAAKRIAQAIVNKEVIGLETDHDCDGQTSHAVLWHNLVYNFGCLPDNICSYVGHRLTEGYGLSVALTQRILNDPKKPSLIITADNGSSDQDRIKILAEQNIDVIVTDHHALPTDGPPKSSYACINPNRKDCNYPDKYIAGCMVAWLLMSVVRQELLQINFLPKNAPKLLDTLDYVAVGTVADCVSMAKSYNNRAIVKFGLKLINKAIKPCWQALSDYNDYNIFNSEDLGFKIGPLLNSDGRLSSAMGSVSFLLAKSVDQANKLLLELIEQNKLRKKIQQQITQSGVQMALEQIKLNKVSICIYQESGHTGVHGISASRIKDLFGRPVIIFAPKIGSTDYISGSARSIDALHIRDLLQQVYDLAPDIITAFGGHQGAAGITIKKSGFKLFAELFEQSCKQQLDLKTLGPVIFTDGSLAPQDISLVTLESFYTLEPFGREFEAPVFQAVAIVKAITAIGATGIHAKLVLEINRQKFTATWFNCRSSNNDLWPVTLEQQITIAYTLKLNNFRGIKRCDLLILGAS